ncbi:MAG: MBL fold metallo-hydrolase [Acidobacteriota bacterium]
MTYHGAMRGAKNWSGAWRLGLQSALVLAGLVAVLMSGCQEGDTTAAEKNAAPAEESARQTQAGEERVTHSGPFVRVLGTVQDGGLPHAACHCSRCELARHDPAQRRYVASLALVLPASGRVVVIDATPDLHPQLEQLADLRQGPEGRVDRAPIDGVFLTHAHIGHYLGLAFLGFEVVHTSELPVYCTPRMAEFLRRNGPWSQLVEKRNIDLVETAPGGTADLGDGVRVDFLQVPHRDEYSDTVGFRVHGPNRSLLYVPDTDAWSAWETPLSDVLEGVDVAILDGSFYSLDELPGRDISQVKHPLITVSMDLLQERVDAGRNEVYFSHLNHTNPALEPGSEARREIQRRGFQVLAEGLEIGL